MKEIEWVMGFLVSIEATGQHAPVETMQRIAESHKELITALQRLYDLRNIFLTRAGAAGHRYSPSEDKWVCDPWTQAFKDAGIVLWKLQNNESETL